MLKPTQDLTNTHHNTDHDHKEPKLEYGHLSPKLTLRQTGPAPCCMQALDADPISDSPSEVERAIKPGDVG